VHFPGDIEGEPPRKRVPTKVMWYAPIIPRLKRLFRNKEHAKLLRWHMEDHMKDEKLRHPADDRQWRKIEREFPGFAGDARNLWFGLSTDGMNYFGEQSCSHSTCLANHGGGGVWRLSDARGCSPFQAGRGGKVEIHRPAGVHFFCSYRLAL
jgi:hypothetical protein